MAIGAVLLSLLLLAVCDREVPLEVESHSWTRTIPVERFKTLSQSDWCSGAPADARISSRNSELHHYDKVPDGEECHSEPESCSESCRDVDHGNGAFSEVCTQTCTPARTVCKTRYRDVPVYADKCYYEIDRWVVTRSAELHREDHAPQWPDDPPFSGCAIEQLGCERLGMRYGTYLLHLVTPDEDPEDRERFACERPEPSWQATSVGARYLGDVSRLTGELDCETLVPAR